MQPRITSSERPRAINHRRRIASQPRINRTHNPDVLHRNPSGRHMLQLILLVGNTNAPTFAHSPHRQSFKSWGDLVWDMIWAVAEIDREQGSGKRYRLEISDSDEPCMKLLKFRPAEDEARQALPRQIRAELQAARTS